MERGGQARPCDVRASPTLSQRSCLQDEAMIFAIRKQRRAVDDIFTLLAAARRTGRLALPHFSRASFLWAVGLVCSRTVRIRGSTSTGLLAIVTFVDLAAAVAAVSIDQGGALLLPLLVTTAIAWWLLSGETGTRHVLCPLVDAFNHESPPAGRAATGIAQRGASYQVVARDRVATSEQVHISYGRDNDTLLRFYGFVEPGNPLDATWLPAPDGGASLVRLASVAGLDPTSRALLASREGEVHFLREACARRLRGMSTSLAHDLRLLEMHGRRKAASDATTSDVVEAREGARERLLLALRWRIEKKRLLHSFYAEWQHEVVD